PRDLIFIMNRTRVRSGALTKPETALLENLFALNSFYDSTNRLVQLSIIDIKTTGRPLNAIDQPPFGESLQYFANSMLAGIDVLSSLFNARFSAFKTSRSQINDGFYSRFTRITQHSNLIKDI